MRQVDSERVSVLHAALFEELLVGDPEWERQQPPRQSPEYDALSRDRDRDRSPGATRPPSPPQRTNALSEADCRQLLARVASDDEELQRAVLANYAAQSKVRSASSCSCFWLRALRSWNVACAAAFMCFGCSPAVSIVINSLFIKRLFERRVRCA